MTSNQDSIEQIPLKSDSTRVSVLSEALPYIQKFAGRRIVIKYGGAAMINKNLKEAVFRDIALLSTVGAQPVIIHGGGPEINQWLEKLGIKSEFRDGLRITDRQTMDIVEMVLVGRVNKQIVNGLNKLGTSSVGLCGIDGNLIVARQFGDGSHGLVGEVAKINSKVIEPLLDKGYIPVISSVAASQEGSSFNINADTVAGEISAALGAEKLVLLTDTLGVLSEKDNSESLIKNLRLQEARKLIKEGIVNGGMLPKVECCIRAISQGVNAAHIVDGRISHSLLLELFTDAGIGTMISGRS